MNITAHFGWALPAHERHLQVWMANPKNAGFTLNGRQAYQGKKQVAAMRHVVKHRVAIDVGGHVGFHSYNLAHTFETVHAFEPVALHRECFTRNVKAKNVTLHAVALGREPGSVRMNTEDGSSGNTTVAGEGDIPMVTLDSFGFAEVDYIKIDVEGGEADVIAGAEQTIRLCRPTVMVEQKRDFGARFGHAPKAAVDLLVSWGYRQVEELSGDHILVPK